MGAAYGNRLQQRVINMRKFGFSAVVTVVLLGAVLSARADSTEAKERAARKACLSGNVQKGVEILSEIFVETEDPTLIYNQGRCFEQNGRHKEAINRFREYLRRPRTSAPKPRQTPKGTSPIAARCWAKMPRPR